MSEYGFCPLLKRDCIGPKCAWFFAETNEPECVFIKLVEYLSNLQWMIK